MKKQFNQNNSTWYIKIANRNKQTYLEERGLYPIYEYEDYAWYERSPQLRSLLVDYQVISTFYQSTKKH